MGIVGSSEVAHLFWQVPDVRLEFLTTFRFVRAARYRLESFLE